MDDAAALEAQRWVAVLFGLGLYGYFALEAARRLGLPWTVHGFLMHTLFFVVAVLAIRAIYRLRAYLGAAIERWGAASGSGPRPLSALASLLRDRAPRARRLGGAGLPRLGGRRRPRPPSC